MKKSKRTSQYLIGKRMATVTPAEGVTGDLCSSTGGRHFFRVYKSGGRFTDYDLRHDDLTVTIAQNAMASFYRCGQDRFLDHSPAVLGLDESREQAETRTGVAPRRRKKHPAR